MDNRMHTYCQSGWVFVKDVSHLREITKYWKRIYLKLGRCPECGGADVERGIKWCKTPFDIAAKVGIQNKRGSPEFPPSRH
jgi:hypothetical protein